MLCWSRPAGIWVPGQLLVRTGLSALHPSGAKGGTGVPSCDVLAPRPVARSPDPLTEPREEGGPGRFWHLIPVSGEGPLGVGEWDPMGECHLWQLVGAWGSGGVSGGSVGAVGSQELEEALLPCCVWIDLARLAADSGR